MTKFKPVFKECHELYETRKTLLEGTGQADGLDVLLDTLRKCKSTAHWDIVKRKEEYIKSERANKRRRISEEISAKDGNGVEAGQCFRWRESCYCFGAIL